MFLGSESFNILISHYKHYPYLETITLLQNPCITSKLLENRPCLTRSMTDALETGKIRVRHMTHCLCEEEPCTPCGFDNPHRTRPVAEGGQTRLASGFRIRTKSYFFFLNLI